MSLSLVQTTADQRGTHLHDKIQNMCKTAHACVDTIGSSETLELKNHCVTVS